MRLNGFLPPPQKLVIRSLIIEVSMSGLSRWQDTVPVGVGGSGGGIGGASVVVGAGQLLLVGCQCSGEGGGKERDGHTAAVAV